MNKIWLDDMRPAPEGYLWVKDYDEAIAAWEKYGTPEVASLDHDLWGWTAYVPRVKEYSGYDFTRWLCGDNPADEDSGRWPTLQLSIHTDRTDGRENIARLIEAYGPYDTRETYERTYSSWKESGYQGNLVNVYGYIYYTKDAPKDPKVQTTDSLGEYFGGYYFDW